MMALRSSRLADHMRYSGGAYGKRQKGEIPQHFLAWDHENFRLTLFTACSFPFSREGFSDKVRSRLDLHTFNSTL